jgi:deoxycytidylate deaminase
MNLFAMSSVNSRFSSIMRRSVTCALQKDSHEVVSVTGERAQYSPQMGSASHSGHFLS